MLKTDHLTQTSCIERSSSQKPPWVERSEHFAKAASGMRSRPQQRCKDVNVKRHPSGGVKMRAKAVMQ